MRFTMGQYASRNDAQELALQQVYMEKAASYVAELKQQLGRQPLCCVTTFGCQMNTEVEIEKAA